jgi:HSP20 family molecular chaperone IbpA
MNDINRNTKYDQTINVPEDIELESECSNYSNRILEITFKKERTKKQKSRQINT